MSPNLSRWILATLVFIGLGLVVSRAGLPTARWIMLGLLMLVFFFGGTSARRSASPAEAVDDGEGSDPSGALLGLDETERDTADAREAETEDASRTSP